MKQLNSKYVWKLFLTIWFSLSLMVLVFLITVILLAENPSLSDMIIICIKIDLGLAVVSWIFAKLTHRFFKYELKKEGFRKEVGVISRKYHTIPYNRIQNVDIYRDILDRLMGLSCVLIQTAGNDSPFLKEGELPGLSVDVAEQLRDELVNRINPKTGGI